MQDLSKGPKYLVNGKKCHSQPCRCRHSHDRNALNAHRLRNAMSNLTIGESSVAALVSNQDIIDVLTGKNKLIIDLGDPLFQWILLQEKKV